MVPNNTSAHSVTRSTPPNRVIISMRRPSTGQMLLQEMKCSCALTAASSMVSKSQCRSMPPHAVRILTERVHFIAMWKAASQGTIHSLASKISMPTWHPAMGGRREGSKGMNGNLTGHMPSCMQLYHVESLVAL